MEAGHGRHEQKREKSGIDRGCRQSILSRGIEVAGRSRSGGGSRRTWVLGAIGLSLCLQGCAMVALAGVGTVAGTAVAIGIDTAVERTLNAIAYRTFTAPLDDIRRAALGTLGRMGMPVTADEKTATGWTISATAADRTVELELERLTPDATRMRVVVNEGDLFFKDRATAAEIVLQTTRLLQDEKNPAAESNSQ